MKFFRILVLCSALAASHSCNQEKTDRWAVEVPASPKVVVTDISKEFYDANVPLEEFQQKYRWFQGTVSDEDFAVRKADPAEIALYREAAAKIDVAKLQNDLTELFARINHYFPGFKAPKVFLFSSALQMAADPIFFQRDANYLFIDITGFMGEKNRNYQGLDLYRQKSMNPQNIVPKVSEILAEQFVPAPGNQQKFLDMMVYNGKIMTLQDAFLPKFQDHLKMSYTEAQYQWAAGNEANIWNYFVENSFVFSDDARLGERFLAPGPFSKFYTEIDNESSPQIGIFTGWQICRKFLDENPDVALKEFLKMPANDIFNRAKYKPE